MKKITFINEAAKTRLKAIEMFQNGNVTLNDVATAFGVHITTISEWIRMYEEGGAARLNAPLKPRPKHHLDKEDLEARLLESTDRRLLALLDLANGKGLNETAQVYGVTPQGLAKWRRQYLEGKL